MVEKEVCGVFKKSRGEYACCVEEPLRRLLKRIVSKGGYELVNRD